MKKIELTAEELNVIEALRSKAQNQGTGNANGNNGSNKDEQPKRSYRIPPVYKILGKAKRLFLKQVTKDIEAKKACIKLALASYDDLYPDTLRFDLDFRAERERLTDSKKFCKACKELGLNPIDVADNVIFEGKTVLQKVLKDGLQVVGENVHMFNAPLWKDSENLYSVDDTKQNETKEGADA